MESSVLEGTSSSPARDSEDQPVAVRSVERSLAGRWSAYTDEVERLIRAGLAVMQRGETTNPRVSEIVAEAGLSNQAFYRHFRSKEELLLAISDDGLRQLVSYLEHQMAKELSPGAKVRRWVEGILAQAADPLAADATRAVVLNAGRLKEAFPEESARSEERIKEPLRRVLVEACADASRAEPDRDADAAYRVAMGSMEAWLTRPGSPSVSDIAHVVRFVLSGLGMSGET